MTLSMWQIIFAFVFLFCAAGSIFHAMRSRKMQSTYCSVGFLGILLVVVMPGWLTAICALIGVIGICILIHGKSTGNFRKSVTGMILLICGLVAFLIGRAFMGPDDDETLRWKLQQYGLSQYEKLGRYAKEQYPDKSVMAVVPENMPERQKEFLKAFEKGYGSSIDVVEQGNFDYNRFREENTGLDRDTYEEKLQEAKQEFSLENIFQSSEMQGAEVVLLLTGLSGNRLECLDTLNSLKKASKILLIPADFAGRKNVLSPYIREGQIGALVMMNADSSIQNDVPENMEEAFAARYVLVTAENIDAMLEDPKYRVLLFDDEAGQNEE